MTRDDACKGMHLSESSEALGGLLVLLIIPVIPLVPKQKVQAGSLGTQRQLLHDAKALQGEDGGAAEQEEG